MSIAEMRAEFSKTIDGLDDEQFQEIYGVVKHCLNEDDNWDEPIPFAEIAKSMKQIENGEGIPLKTAMADLRNKFGLNG